MTEEQVERACVAVAAANQTPWPTGDVAFDRFAISKVPSFVLVRDGTRPVACASGSCAPADSFLRSTGDVSLDYALEHMQRSAPAFAPAAELFLKRIKG